MLLGVFLAIGCTDNGSETANEDDADTPTSKQESEIIVSAAASLTEAFSDMEPQFEAENPGIDVNFNFGASGNLRKQIEEELQLMFSLRRPENMDILAEELIENTTRKTSELLVLIVPANVP